MVRSIKVLYRKAAVSRANKQAKLDHVYNNKTALLPPLLNSQKSQDPSTGTPSQTAAQSPRSKIAASTVAIGQVVPAKPSGGQTPLVKPARIPWTVQATRRLATVDHMPLPTPLPYELGDVRLLRSLLLKDVTLMAIDTELERHGLLEHVVEIGITTLRTRDIMDVRPGPYARDWLRHLNHHHMVLDVSRFADGRMSRSLFGKSRLVNAEEAGCNLLKILESSANDSDRGQVYLVGHSFQVDLRALRRSPSLRIDLLNSGISNLTIPAVFDTLKLAHDARRLGTDIPSLRLGHIVKSLGISPEYRHPTALRGWHNASNDAAYTMIGLLLFAIRWEDFIARKGSGQPIS